MMRPGHDLPAVFLCKFPVDFRKGMQGLAVLVEAELARDPFSEQLFVFTNRRHDAVKILYWERNGFCLWHDVQGSTNVAGAWMRRSDQETGAGAIPVAGGSRRTGGDLERSATQLAARWL